MINKTVWKNA